MDITTQELVNGINEYYTVSTLKRFYKEVLGLFLSRTPDCIERGADQKLLKQLELQGNKPARKLLMVHACAEVLSNKELFLYYLNEYTSEEIKFLWEKCIWEQSVLEKTIRKETGAHIRDRGNFYIDWNGNLDPDSVKFEYQIFDAIAVSDDTGALQIALVLPRFIRGRLLEYFISEEDRKLKVVEDLQLKPSEILYEEELTAQQELSRLLLYLDQNEIKVASNGKVAFPTANKIRKTLSLKDFYPDNKKLQFLRTYLLTSSMHRLFFSTTQSPAAIIKEVIHKIFIKPEAHKTGVCLTGLLLPHLKGTQNTTWEEFDLSHSFQKIISSFEKEKWVRIRDLLQYCDINFVDLEVVPVSHARRYYYFSTKNDYGYSNKCAVESALYNDYVACSILSGFFFTLAAFGCVDIVYDTPDTEEQGVTYATLFDGLRYIRLNALGEYVFGRSDSYESKIKDYTEDTILDDQALLIKLKEAPDVVFKELYLSFSEELNPCCYKVSFSSFMKDCQKVSDVERKINMFQETVKNDLPPNWKAFFEEITRKCKPMQAVAKTKVFQLNPEDKELHYLISKDPKIKAIIKKAEDFQIIVKEQDFSKLKKLLKDQYGYLLS